MQSFLNVITLQTYTFYTTLTRRLHGRSKRFFRRPQNLNAPRTVWSICVTGASPLTETLRPFRNHCHCYDPESVFQCNSSQHKDLKVKATEINHFVLGSSWQYSPLLENGPSVRSVVHGLLFEQKKKKEHPVNTLHMNLSSLTWRGK